MCKTNRELYTQMSLLMDERDRMRAEVELLTVENKRLREDAERWRDLPRRLDAFWDSCKKESNGAYIVIGYSSLKKHLIEEALK